MNTTKNTADSTRPNTNDMVVIHRGLRRESRLLIDLVAAVAPGDTARAALLAEHLRDYVLGLTNHHHGEDENLWEPLLARVDLDADVVLRMEAQHKRVEATLSAVAAAVPAWESGAGETGRDTLVARLTEHRAVLVEHLDDEEKNLLPLAAKHVTLAEWEGMGEHFLESTPKPKLLFFLGMALEEATDAERTAFLSGLPWFARGLWYAVGRPQYARRMRRIRG